MAYSSPIIQLFHNRCNASFQRQPYGCFPIYGRLSSIQLFAYTPELSFYCK